MTTHEQRQQKLLEYVINPAIEFSKQSHDDENQQRLEEVRDRVQNEEVFIVIAGEPNEGKSTVFNAAIEEPNLSPEGVDITTNVVFLVQYAEQENFTVRTTEESGTVSTRSINRHEIVDYVSEQCNKENFQQVARVIGGIPNERLKRREIWGDLPGVGGLNPQHEVTAKLFLPEADVILFVSEASKTLSDTELNFVKEIWQRNRNIIFVATKIDQSDYQPVIQANRARLSQVLECFEDEIILVPVSAMDKLDYLQTKNSRYLERSNFEDLERAIENLLGQGRAQLVIQAALVRVIEIIERMILPIEAELQVYQGEQKATQENKAHLNRKTTQLRKQLQQNATWRTDLDRQVRTLKTKLQSNLDQSFKDLSSWLEEQLVTTDLLARYPEVVAKAQANANEVCLNLAREGERQAVEIQTEIARSLELGELPDVLSSPSISMPSVPDNLPKRGGLGKWWQKGWHVATRMFYSGSAGGAMGFVFDLLLVGFGFFIPTIIFIIAGAATGLFKGLEEIKKQDLQEAQPKIRLYFKKFVDVSKEACRKELIDQWAERLQPTMAEWLTKQIEQEIDACQKALEAIDTASTQPSSQIPQRVQDSQSQLKELNQLLEQASEPPEDTKNWVDED